jgi:hypothetical protein
MSTHQPFADMLAGTPGHPLPWQATAPAPIPSPAYGPAGKPSPGRLVRYHEQAGDVPAVIHQLTDEATGECILCYDVPKAAQLAGVPQPVSRVSTLASYGSDPGQWDYWPRV